MMFMKTMAVMLARKDNGGALPAAVRDGLYDGTCMDAVYDTGGNDRHCIDRIVLEGVPSACWVEGFQEFLFDLLANFPAVRWLAIEPACMDGAEAAAL